MSEMTATRMARSGILAAIAVLWLVAAYELWQTEVPDDLPLPDLDERRYFGPLALAEFERPARAPPAENARSPTRAGRTVGRPRCGRRIRRAPASRGRNRVVAAPHGNRPRRLRTMAARSAAGACGAGR